MPEGRSPIAIHFGSDTEEEHGFYQGRLRLFAGCIFLISAGFYAIDVAASLPALGAAVALLWMPKLLHLSATLLAGAVWFALRQFRPSMIALQRLDAGTTILLSGGHRRRGLGPPSPDAAGCSLAACAPPGTRCPRRAHPAVSGRGAGRPAGER